MTTRPSLWNVTFSCTSACVPTIEVRRAALDVREQRVLVQPRRAAGQQVDAEARLRQQPRDVAVVLRREDLGRRHERHLQPVLHRDDRREQRDDRLARADVALQQPVHRLRPQHVVDDLLDRLPLPGRQLERQHLRADARMRSSTFGTNGFSSVLRRVPPPGVADLKEEELLEDQPPLRRRPEGVQLLDRRLVRRKVRLARAPARRGMSCSRARRSGGSDVGNLRRQLVERLPHEPAAACSASPCRSSRRTARCGRCARPTGRPATSSYSGFMKCSPVESSLTSPKMTTCRCGLRMSARNAWFIQVQRIAPLASPTTA